MYTTLQLTLSTWHSNHYERDLTHHLPTSCLMNAKHVPFNLPSMSYSPSTVPLNLSVVSANLLLSLTISSTSNLHQQRYLASPCSPDPHPCAQPAGKLCRQQQRASQNTSVSQYRALANPLSLFLTWVQQPIYKPLSKEKMYDLQAKLLTGWLDVFHDALASMPWLQNLLHLLAWSQHTRMVTAHAHGHSTRAWTPHASIVTARRYSCSTRPRWHTWWAANTASSCCLSSAVSSKLTAAAFSSRYLTLLVPGTKGEGQQDGQQHPKML